MISGWTILVALLIVELVLLAGLLFPTPRIVKQLISSVFRHQRQYIAIMVIGLSAVTYMEYVEMQNLEERENKIKAVPTADHDQLCHVRINRVRAERNFYIIAFTFTILIVLIRVHSLLDKLEAKEKKNN